LLVFAFFSCVAEAAYLKKGGKWRKMSLYHQTGDSGYTFNEQKKMLENSG